MRLLGAVTAIALAMSSDAALAGDTEPPTLEQIETGVLITASTEVGWLRTVCPGYLAAEVKRRDAAIRTDSSHPPSLAATRCEKVLQGKQPEAAISPD